MPKHVALNEHQYFFVVDLELMVLEFNMFDT